METLENVGIIGFDNYITPQGYKYSVHEGENVKLIKSEKYNTLFNKQTGFFLRWGEETTIDPDYSLIGPEIADIEISSGMCHNNCPFCYKGNKKDGKLHNMTLDEFKIIFDKLTKYRTLTQIAFGITSPSDNPEFFEMMKYSKEHGVIPNYTCNGTDMTEELAKITASLCGAIAISVNDKEKSYDSVKMLTDLGMKQVNFHVVAHNNSFDKIMGIIDDIKNDKRLEKLNALVLLKYKPKGTNAGIYSSLTQEQYNLIFKKAKEVGIPIGFDSCSCFSYLKAIEDEENYDLLSQYAEPCESTMFSIYVNSHCEVSPCSFSENEIRDNGENWTSGINLLEIEDFNKDVWFNDRIVHFRNNLLKNGRKCPMYDLDCNEGV